jgi:nicotinamide riboside kinase
MRIAFTGPESSGKTTLSLWLANELSGSTYVSEFARKYLEERQLTRASEEEFKQIASIQCERFTPSKESIYQIFDTDIFVLRIWNDEVFKLKLPELELNDSYSMDIHFLCTPDLIWEEDPLRSAPDQDHRDRLFLKYKTELIHHQARFTILEGNEIQKKELILQTIHKLNTSSLK